MAFSEEEVGKIINEVGPASYIVLASARLMMEQTLDNFLNQKTYDEKLVPHWIADISELLMQRLVALRKPFKYVGTKRS